MFGNYIGSLENRMDLNLRKRDTNIQNISNFNTPEYKTKKYVEAEGFNSQLNNALKVTNGKHIAISDEGSGGEIVETSSGKVRQDGNNVNLASEMMDLTKSNLLFNTSIKAINEELKLHKIAIGQ